MTSTGRHDAPRYATLRDYLGVVRRNRWLIVLVVIAFTAAAFALTARQKKTYQASVTVMFQDTTQELALLGATPPASTTEVNISQLNQQMVTRPDVIQHVKHELGSPLSLAALAAPISSFVNSQTSFLVIQATSGDPAYAARLANAFATADAVVTQHNTRAQYAALARAANAQFARLPATTRANSFTASVYQGRIYTLDFLAQTADPVQIVQSASVPTTPAGPRILRNTVLGLLLGLTVALLAAFVRDALDRRLRRTADITDRLAWPILGNVRESAFGAPLFVTTDGKTVDEGDRESFRILLQNVRYLDVDNPPRSVVVTSALPEEGKSTVARALACASAIAGTRTLLVECDLRRPSLAQSFDVAKTPGLTDFLLGAAKPADIVQVLELPVPVLPVNGSSVNGTAAERAGAQHTSSAVLGEPRRLAVITSGRPAPETAELLGSGRFKAFLREVTAAYEQVIIDASPLLSVADTARLLPDVDVALLCVRAGRTTQEQAAALQLALERIPHRLIGVVVTGVRPGGEHDLGYYSYAYAYEPQNVS